MASWKPANMADGTNVCKEFWNEMKIDIIVSFSEIISQYRACITNV